MSLKSISLRDFVIVREMDLDLSNGFTVLTGETGAGKSILIGALQLAPRDGDATIRGFEIGMKLWKAGFYVRFGGDTLQFGPTFNSKPQDLDRLFDAVGEVLNKID